MCNLLAEAEEAVVEGVASSYSLLTQREPQHQVKLHVVQLSEAHTDPVSMSTEQGPVEPTKGPRDGHCPLDNDHDQSLAHPPRHEPPRGPRGQEPSKF